MAGFDLINVTGGLGFIGKYFVRQCLDRGAYVRNFDKVSYAADVCAQEEFLKHPLYSFHNVDITHMDFLPESDVLVNFAAESHVDNAITSSVKFCHTNILGVHNLLELVRAKHEAARPIFVQISTDEVYGDITSGSHDEDTRLVPSNPYSATKASADMLIKSYGRTYGVDYRIVRPANNYGPHQYPEKLIPKSVWRMKRGIPAIMHGDGSYVRSWQHVEDTADAIFAVIEKGAPQQIYNAGGNIELKNIVVLRAIAKHLGVAEKDAWRAVSDRSGQDVRYALSDQRLKGLGWSPRRQFLDELPKIIDSFDPTRFV